MKGWELFKKVEEEKIIKGDMFKDSNGRTWIFNGLDFVRNNNTQKLMKAYPNVWRLSRMEFTKTEEKSDLYDKIDIHKIAELVGADDIDCCVANQRNIQALAKKYNEMLRYLKQKDKEVEKNG